MGARPTITIPDRFLMYMDVNDNLILKDGAKELLAAIANQKDMDVIIWNDSFHPTRQRSGSVNYNDIVKELKDELKSDSFQTWAELSPQKRSDLRSSGSLGYLNSSGPRAGLVELADRFHNRGGSNIPNDWHATRHFSEPEIRLFSSLGAKLFEEDFDFENNDIKISYKMIDGELKCELKLEDAVEVGNVDICRNSIGSLTKWINEKERKCGEFSKDGQHLLGEVNYLKCMPPQYQSYVDFRQVELNTVCADVNRCLGTIVGEDGEKLVNDFIDLIDSFNIPQKNRDVFDNVTIDYEEIVQDMKGDLLEFKEACTPKYVQYRFNEISNESDESKLFFEEKLESFASVLSDTFGVKISPEEFDVLKSKTDDSYKKCVVKNADYYRARGGLSEKYAACESQLLQDVLETYVKTIFPDKPFDEIYAQSTEMERNICFPGEGFREKRNLSYDLERCSKIIEDKHKYGDAFSYLTEQNKFIKNIDRGSHQSLNVGYMQSRNVESEFGEELRKSLFECVDKNEGDAQIKSCFDNSLKKETASKFVKSISMEEDILAKVRLTQEHRNSLSDRLLRDEGFSECIDKLGEKKKSYNDCELIGKNFILSAVSNRGTFFDNAYYQARRGLLADLEERVRVLPHDTSTFHWVTSELIGHDGGEALSLKSTRSYAYAVGREYAFHAGPTMNRIIGEPAGATQAGRGLYTSTDPSATSNYGDVLLEIRLPEGAKYIDTTDANYETGFNVSKYTYDKFIEAGCDLNGENYRERRQENQVSRSDSPRIGDNVYVHRSSDESYATIRKTVFEVDKVCHQVFSSVISELDVKFLSYSYGSQRPGFCDSAFLDRGRGHAFVMIDAPLRGNVRTYNRATIEEAIKEFEEKKTPIPEDIKRLMGIYNFRKRNRAEVKDRYSDQETLDYWKKRIYDCDLLQGGSD